MTTKNPAEIYYILYHFRAVSPIPNSHTDLLVISAMTKAELLIKELTVWYDYPHSLVPVG